MSNATHEQDLRRQLKNERSTLHDLVWELDEVEVQLAEIERQGDAAAAHDQDELAELRHHRTELEEAVLQQMLHIDQLQQSLDQEDYSRQAA